MIYLRVLNKAAASPDDPYEKVTKENMWHKMEIQKYRNTKL